jgi:hypothetical protein
VRVAWAICSIMSIGVQAGASNPMEPMTTKPGVGRAKVPLGIKAGTNLVSVVAAKEPLAGQLLKPGSCRH